MAFTRDRFHLTGVFFFYRGTFWAAVQQDRESGLPARGPHELQRAPQQSRGSPSHPGPQHPTQD